MKIWTFCVAMLVVAFLTTMPATTYGYTSVVICGYATLGNGDGEIGCDHWLQISLSEAQAMGVPENTCLQSQLTSQALYRTGTYNSSTQSMYHSGQATSSFSQNGTIHPGTWSGSGALQHLDWTDENYYSYLRIWTTGPYTYHNDADDLDVGGITWYRPACGITQNNVGQGSSNNHSYNLD